MTFLDVNPNTLILFLTGFGCICILSIAFALDILKGVDVFLSAKWYFLFGFFIFMIVGLLKNIYIYDVPASENFETLLVACFVTAIALGSFLLSYGKAQPRQLLPEDNKVIVLNSDTSLNLILFFAVALFAVGIAGYSRYDPIGNPDGVLDANNFDRFFVFFHLNAGILLTYIAIERYYVSSTNRRLILSVSVLLLIICFISVLTRSSRYISLYLVSFGPIYLYYFNIYIRGSKLSFRVVTYIVAGVVFVFFAGNIIKSLQLMFYDDGYVDILSDKFIFSTSERIGNLEFVDAFDNLCHIIEAFYMKEKFLLGESLSAPFVNFIPRDIWPDKPSAFGVSMAEEVYGFYAPFNLAPSLAGEFLANFGLIGVAIGFAFFGRLARYVDIAIGHSNRGRHHMIYIIPVIYLFSMENRGDFTLNNEVLYVVLPLYAVVWLAKNGASIAKKRIVTVS